MGGEGGFKGGTIYNPRTPGRRYAKQNSGRLTRQNSPGRPRTGSSVEIPHTEENVLKRPCVGCFIFWIPAPASLGVNSGRLTRQEGPGSPPEWFGQGNGR